MLKKIVLGLLLTSSLFAETELWKFFKYSTAYASFSLNAPRYQDDRFAIIGGLSTGDIIFEKTEMALVVVIIAAAPFIFRRMISSENDSESS